ncbi:glycosyltransferase family 2 protein [Hyphomonas johnsonii]|uniref:Glycosyltransferase n=1 Tax=Hyphomonas johnsonii MHS-2 TaxID=1280950 RepID=A0A059FQF3_9PROT|nr:glycosyltransferase family 2 protein [Hyphomonas johnsonii]KCZ92683.1 glycosyltransferase [Hyphomonas johnsonii MHS-2]
MGFSRSHPEGSAIVAITPGQRGALRRVFVLIGLAGLLAPIMLVRGALAAGLFIFGATIAFRLAMVLSASRSRPAQQVRDADQVLYPVYTILIALKDEAATAPQLARAIAALDYPADRIDLKLLVETGDDDTHAALRAEDWPIGTELLVLPPGLPQTKPRALNYGLARAKGAYVVVYDAEDRPDPAQLRAAAEAFARDPAGLACVQAPLVGTHAGHNWLAGQWALEYAIQFSLILPALARFRLPIALGGTSNHFRRARLVESGGWDAWNVTEDADLGLRLARLGMQVGVISPPTEEAPPNRIPVWLGQRSRWLKGYLQTWFVLMRHPRASARQMGVGGFAAMQLTLGASVLSAFVHGPWALWCLVCVISPDLSLGPVGAGLLAASYGASLVTGLLAPRPKQAGYGFVLLTAPFYWPLQTIAMMRAVYGLLRMPHYWAKTPHAPV